MTTGDLLRVLHQAPLIASCQASPGPMQDPSTLVRLAKASLQEGVQVLRLEGVETIRAVREFFDGPIIGLIKREYEGSTVYITPTRAEVDQLLTLGVQIIALDATDRTRPGEEELADLIATIHAGGSLAMADCDTAESAWIAMDAGANLIGTTLAGYTENRPATAGPDLELLRSLTQGQHLPVIAEGRYAEPWHAEAAMRIGAAGVVIGGALNDPVKQTSRFVRSARPGTGRVGAVDLGGTWLRFGIFGPGLHLESSERIPLPATHQERLDWIGERLAMHGLTKVGVSAGGVIDPATAEVVEAKGFIPDYVGQRFAWDGVEVHALNDGLATAYGHACVPTFAGTRVAVLALGTGVGAGLVERGRICHGRRGEYPRWNDMPLPGGSTVEEALGGLSLTAEPTEEQKRAAVAAAESLIEWAHGLWFPDHLVIAGGVGLSPWMSEALGEREDICFSGFGPDAGLFGAAALALFPPLD